MSWLDPVETAIHTAWSNNHKPSEIIFGQGLLDRMKTDPPVPVAAVTDRSSRGGSEFHGVPYRHSMALKPNEWALMWRGDVIGRGEIK